MRGINLERGLLNQGFMKLQELIHFSQYSRNEESNKFQCFTRAGVQKVKTEKIQWKMGFSEKEEQKHRGK